MCGARWKIGGIELLDSMSIGCFSPEATSSRIFVEADGELLGTLPAQISIVPDCVTLLTPDRAK
jgi:diacylglycerol kinase family enzyme